MTSLIKTGARRLLRSFLCTHRKLISTDENCHTHTTWVGMRREGLEWVGMSWYGSGNAWYGLEMGWHGLVWVRYGLVCVGAGLEWVGYGLGGSWDGLETAWAWVSMGWHC